MSSFRLVSASEASRIGPGTILFLPSKADIPKGAFTDSELNEGAFNHPVSIISCPTSKEIKHSSIVQIAIMTSFNGTAIKKHLAAKGIKKRTGAEAAAYSGYLRVATASKPYAQDTLKLRNSKGMKRDCSYVNIKHTYMVELRALALYGNRNEEVDAYRLTAHATKKLIGAILEYKERKKKVKGTQKNEKESKKATKLNSLEPPRERWNGARKEAFSTPEEQAVFKRIKWRGRDSNKDAKKETIDLIPLISPRSGLRPRYATEHGLILVSPRLTTENPFRILNPRAYQ